MYYACSCSWATYVLDFEPETTPNNVAGSFTRGMNCFGYARLHLRRLHGRWCRDASTKRKRGRRGGVKNRLRRQPATPPHHMLYLQTSSRCTTQSTNFTQSADTTTSIERPAWWPFARHGWTLPVQTMTAFWTGLLCTVQTERKNRARREEGVCAFT